MHVFISKASDIMDQLATPVMPEPEMIQNAPPSLEDFKTFAIQYVQEHDELPENHPALQHITTSANVNDIEAFLRQNLDYCDDCMLKLFRKYASGAEQPEGCPCGGE